MAGNARRKLARTGRCGFGDTARARSGAGQTSGRPDFRFSASEYERAASRLSGKSEIRILFAFDPIRQAILLVAGDKSGQWQRWYRKNIPIADELYDRHLEQLRRRK